MAVFAGPMGALWTPESVEISYDLSISWSDTVSGKPVALDDGAEWDALESRSTIRLTPTEMRTLHAAIKAGDTLSMQGGSYALGPDWPLSGQLVSVTDFVVDNPSDSAQTLYDCTLSVRTTGLPTPTDSGGVVAALNRCIAYPTVPLDGFRVLRDGGESWVTHAAGHRECKAYVRGMTTAEAASLVSSWRATRGGSYAWTPPGAMEPFGVVVSWPSTVSVRDVRLSRMGRLMWEAEMVVVRL